MCLWFFQILSSLRKSQQSTFCPSSAKLRQRTLLTTDKKYFDSNLKDTKSDIQKSEKEITMKQTGKTTTKTNKHDSLG